MNFNNNKIIIIKEYFRIEMSRYGKKIMILKKEIKLWLMISDNKSLLNRYLERKLVRLVLCIL